MCTGSVLITIDIAMDSFVKYGMWEQLENNRKFVQQFLPKNPSTEQILSKYNMISVPTYFIPIQSVENGIEGKDDVGNDSRKDLELLLDELDFDILVDSTTESLLSE